jgi:hypothetical protein
VRPASVAYGPLPGMNRSMSRATRRDTASSASPTTLSTTDTPNPRAIETGTDVAPISSCLRSGRSRSPVSGSCDSAERASTTASGRWNRWISVLAIPVPTRNPASGVMTRTRG